MLSILSQQSLFDPATANASFRQELNASLTKFKDLRTTMHEIAEETIPLIPVSSCKSQRKFLPEKEIPSCRGQMQFQTESDP